MILYAYRNYNHTGFAAGPTLTSHFHCPLPDAWVVARLARRPAEVG